jgi:RimJ/RimL family protein N-acetyltransferase
MLTLQYPDDELCVAVAQLGALGVHDPSTMPFSVPWTDVPSPQQERNTLQHYWLTRAEWSVDEWHCPFAAVVDGDVVGVQGVIGMQFPKLREVSTGSWVTQTMQGHGIGTEMRQAVLHFVFAGLGAEYAMSGAFEDNNASLGVSAKLPYERTGRHRVVRRDSTGWIIDLRMSRQAWQQIRRDDIEIHGLDECREMFGL